MISNKPFTGTRPKAPKAPPKVPNHKEPPPIPAPLNKESIKEMNSRIPPKRKYTKWERFKAFVIIVSVAVGFSLLVSVSINKLGEDLIQWGKDYDQRQLEKKKHD